jgi:alkylhydroperoxidase family enzyme
MSRLEPSKPRSLFARIVFFFTRRMLGKVPTPMRVTAHNPKIFKGMAQMELAQKGAKSLPPRLRTLVGLRVATRVGCLF